jgi:hypothetical protein
MQHPRAKTPQTRRIIVGIPMTGLLRSEWHLSYVAQVIPCNWSQGITTQFLDQYSPLEFLVADARNIIVHQAITQNYDWLFFIDHDVCLPHNTILRFNERISKGGVPIFGGLYFAKGIPSEPLVYRGLGNSFYRDWKIGDEVWVDGMGLGCTMLNTKILKAVYDDSEEYEVQAGLRVRRVFETPSTGFVDPETGSYNNFVGTEDLAFYQRLIDEEYFEKAGWPEIQKKKYPLLIDTQVFCAHISFDGIRYPSMGEEQEFMRK